jgi:hypothetical protein
MGVFDPSTDAPEKLKQEGDNVSVKFERLTPTTGRVSWNIPAPADGCSADQQAYDGIVVVLNTVANKPTDRPVDGNRYTADATGDPDLHAGDKIGDALVVGAFYGDKTTTSFDITDLVDGAAYFVTAHPVDQQNRYYNPGANGYSLPLQSNEKEPDTKAFHEIALSNPDGSDVIGTDSTGLTAGDVYNFFLCVDGKEYEILVDGANAQTYDELIAEINKQLQLVGNPFQGPLAPNTGGYYYNLATGELFQWNGSTNVPLEVTNHPTDPSLVAAGDYWLDSDSGSNDLFLRDLTNVSWILQTPTVEAGFDVINPSCDSYWYDSVPCDMWKWNGTTWCKRAPVFVQETDPSDPESLSCGSYWLDGDGILSVWTQNGECTEWVQTEAISWDLPPTQIVSGTYWFNDSTNELNLRVGALWEVQTDAFVQDEEPLTNVVGAQWFVPSTEQLFVLDQTNTWVETPVLIYGTDPTNPESCDLWFNTAIEQLFVWDAVSNEWDQVAQFFDQVEDPSASKVLPVGAIWVNNDVYYEWDGGQWVLIESGNVVVWPSDPTQIPVGTIWYQTTLDAYFVWDGSVWNTIEPIVADEDPAVPQLGAFWFNTTTNILSQWNGSAWIPVAYSSAPLAPTVGAVWFDTTQDVLLTWDGTAWVPASQDVTVALNVSEPASCTHNPTSNIVFTREAAGSLFSLRLGMITNATPQIIQPSISYIFKGDLFTSLTARAQLQDPVPGSDGLESIPMYDQQGVGTDGTMDERRELGDSIRRQLGYPTVEVELTQKQIDEAIQSAVEEFRLRSASAYRRVYFMMDLEPGRQRYSLTSKATGFNTIVNIMGIWRMTAAFQSLASASGVYGQTVIQHLYHMGTFDLVSYHLVSDYIEQLEMMFATRVTYTWDENTRQLDVFQSIRRRERVLLDAMIERTEQELMQNRFTKNWIERWAIAQCQLTLSEIRGKFAALPGAGGGVSLNAADLEEKARFNMEQCFQDIDNFVVNDIENLGMGSEFIIG